MNTPYTCTVPVNVNDRMVAQLTAQWFVNGSEYHTLPCTYELLICGEAAFGAVYRAILAARRSVSIICWGFQPSMYFIRNGGGATLEVGRAQRESANLTIGQLLEKKAAEGVKVRVLCWAIRGGYLYDVSGLAGEANASGMGLGVKNRNFGSTDAQFHYDQDWFASYNRDRSPLGNPTNWYRRTFGEHRQLAENLEFRLRGFSLADRGSLKLKHYDDEVSLSAQLSLSGAPSHHQKMVLIDYESPEVHIGFVMGHNILDEYWDTVQHSHYRKASHEGRNGLNPRQDLSARVSGPIVGDLYYNFAQAWRKAGGAAMPLPVTDFADFPLSAAAGKSGFCADTMAMAHIVRTQSQYRVEDIKKTYLQAIGNATRCIYLENQYFRWPPLADAIKTQAARLSAWGKDPANPDHGGPLHLFIVTNSSDLAMGSGAQKTYEMMASLGRPEVMPAVGKLNTLDGLDALEQRLAVRRAALERAEHIKKEDLLRYRRDGWDKDVEAHRRKIAEDEAEQKALQQRQAALAASEDDVVAPEPRPGLKVHVCTLVPPDTPPYADARTRLGKLDDEIEYLEARIGKLGRLSDPRERAQLEKRLAEKRREREAADTYDDKADDGRIKAVVRWPETYVHSKLAIIDDCFMTTGSANINTRSMQVDTELNIAHHNPTIARKARQALWGMHTNGMGVAMEGNFKQAFEAWGHLIDDNRDLEKDKQSPKAALRGFMRTSASRKDLD